MRRQAASRSKKPRNSSETLSIHCRSSTANTSGWRWLALMGNPAEEVEGSGLDRLRVGFAAGLGKRCRSRASRAAMGRHNGSPPTLRSPARTFCAIAAGASVSTIWQKLRSRSSISR